MIKDKVNKLIVFILGFLILLCSVALLFDLFIPSFDYILDINSSNANIKESTFVNINTANVEELVTLPKVGEVIAKRIIEYREKNGYFTKKEDLLKVDGIGKNNFEIIKEYIVI